MKRIIYGINNEDFKQEYNSFKGMPIEVINKVGKRIKGVFDYTEEQYLYMRFPLEGKQVLLELEWENVLSIAPLHRVKSPRIVLDCINSLPLLKIDEE